MQLERGETGEAECESARESGKEKGRGGEEVD